MERLKVEIKREAFSSYDNYSFWDELNINKEENVALKGLSANNNLIIQKSDKGNSAVVLNRNKNIRELNFLELSSLTSLIGMIILSD